MSTESSSVLGSFSYSLYSPIHINRCLLEKDPIAQKHAARIANMRGTYDSMGNRLPPVHQSIVKRGRRRKKRTESSDINLAGTLDIFINY